ncbi:MAG TPA: AraC family transcriptional regulator [Clostridia bacterium]|nr:AraC family transcriptional regulator [Clostridia bacterium]
MGSEILLGLKDIVKIRIIDFCRAERPFIHADRILDFNVFIYIVSGHMKIWENGKEYVVGEKHAFFLKKGLHHLGKSEIPEGTTWYYIHFYDGQDVENSRTMNDYNTLTFSGEFSAEDYNQNIQMPKLLKVNNPKLIERKLNSLHQLFKSSDDFRIAFLSYGTMEVFFDLYIQERNRIKADKADIITRRIISFLENNISQKISSEDISANIGMNYNYISSLFKQKTGMSIQTYHTKIRMNEAAGLLRSSCLNVSEVSNRMGFSDPLYFSHVFRKVTGYSPSEYIKQSYCTTG